MWPKGLQILNLLKDSDLEGIFKSTGKWGIFRWDGRGWLFNAKT